MPVLRRVHMSPFAIVALALILARAIAELWLSRLNQRHVRAHADEVPPAFREMVDQPTYRRSVDYTLAKSRYGNVVTCLIPRSSSAFYSAVCCRGRLKNSWQLSARQFWQWPVFFSLQALHSASSVCHSRGTRSSNSKTDSVSTRPP